MVAIGKLLGRETVAFITNMNQPLGFAVGNSLEVIEAIDTLNGNGPEDFTELCVELASEMVNLAHDELNLEQAKDLVLKAIDDRTALKKLEQMVAMQGGDSNFITDTTKFKPASDVIEVKLDQTGYVTALDALMIGEAAMHLGAGRKVKTDDVDHAVGIVLTKKIGDKVDHDVVALVHANSNADEAIEIIKKAYTLTEEGNKRPDMIYDVVK
jgi:pyrimidine-nucleoside phosphorylase